MALCAKCKRRETKGKSLLCSECYKAFKKYCEIHNRERKRSVN